MDKHNLLFLFVDLIIFLTKTKTGCLLFTESYQRTKIDLYYIKCVYIYLQANKQKLKTTSKLSFDNFPKVEISSFPS